jgi:general secretion pathway protein E
MPADTNTRDLSTVCVPAEFVDQVPLRFAREHCIVAIAQNIDTSGRRFTLACGIPDRWWAIDRAAYKLDAEVQTVSAPADDIQALISRAYHAEAKGVTDVADEISAETDAGEVQLTEDVLEIDDKAPAVRLVHAMLLQAIKQRASDIHVEPGERSVRVRFRIDGVLYERAALGPAVREGIASRIKVMGRMDIAERRLPQDGGVTVRIGERRVDLRISTLPSQHGERIVMRLLDKHTGLLSIDKIGLDGSDADRVRNLLDCSHGIILVTGPTGSGKTTTLYAMLSEMNSQQSNILTLEDPIEYQLPGICQTQVSEKKGLTFACGLRSLVRQDPDIIMVGEIRDFETASVAIQSALTGHLVLSTLHTNDAPSSITRLLDLGVEPYLVASSVNATIAQRLVRQLCMECRDTAPFLKATALNAGWREDDVRYMEETGLRSIAVNRGCAACYNTGFSGRTGIYEVLSMNEGMRSLVGRRVTAGEIKRDAVANGMRTLRQDGMRKVGQLLTTFEEVRGVTQMDFI